MWKNGLAFCRIRFKLNTFFHQYRQIVDMYLISLVAVYYIIVFCYGSRAKLFVSTAFEKDYINTAHGLQMLEIFSRSVRIVTAEKSDIHVCIDWNLTDEVMWNKSALLFKFYRFQPVSEHNEQFVSGQAYSWKRTRCVFNIAKYIAGRNENQNASILFVASDMLFTTKFDVMAISENLWYNRSNRNILCLYGDELGQFCDSRLFAMDKRLALTLGHFMEDTISVAVTSMEEVFANFCAKHVTGIIRVHLPPTEYV